MPLTTHCLNVLTDDSRPAFYALRRSAFCPLGLTFDAPSVPILLNVRHAVFKGITAFCAEEMPVVPVRAEGYNVFLQDWCLAVLASWSKQLVPVKMAVEPKSLITVLTHGHSRSLLEDLAGSTTIDAIEALLAQLLRLRADLHGLKGRSPQV